MKNRNFLSLIGFLAIVILMTSCAPQKYVMVSPAGFQTQTVTTTTTTRHPVRVNTVSQQRPVTYQQAPQQVRVMQQGAIMSRPISYSNVGYSPYASYGYSSGYYGNSSYYPSWEQLQMQAGQRVVGYGYPSYGYSGQVVSGGYSPYGYGVQPRVGIGVNGNAVSVSFQNRNFGISVSGGWNSNQTYRQQQVVQQRPIIYPTY